MAPIDEQGNLWAYLNGSWERVQPANPSEPVPQPRSYHAMSNDGRGALYLHAGCPEKGRLNDLWVFIISSRRWVQLASAPGSERGGASIAFCGSEDVLLRMNGFDGESEIGGSVDVYNPVNDHWTSRQYKADGIEGPEPRSVGCLVCFHAGGKSWLVTAFGERDPSALGHQGAGKMLSDVWAYDIQENKWMKVESIGEDKPQPRGWFAADVLGSECLAVQGGLADDNSRIGDVWLGRFGFN
jgi:N-acetylneuraminic acid mutarotase